MVKITILELPDKEQNKVMKHKGGSEMWRYIIRISDLAQKIGKKKDSITTGLLGGLIGAVFMSGFNLLMYRNNKTEVKTFGQLAGQLLISPWRTNQRKNYILGELLHLSIGSLTGIPMFYVLKKTGKDHYLTKGLAASILTWIFFSTGQKFEMFKRLRFAKSHFSSLWSHIIYGLTTAQAIVLLADKDVFAGDDINLTKAIKKEKYDINEASLINSRNELFEYFNPHRVMH